MKTLQAISLLFIYLTHLSHLSVLFICLIHLSHSFVLSICLIYLSYFTILTSFINLNKIYSFIHLFIDFNKIHQFLQNSSTVLRRINNENKLKSLFVLWFANNEEILLILINFSTMSHSFSFLSSLNKALLMGFAVSNKWGR